LNSRPAIRGVDKLPPERCAYCDFTVSAPREEARRAVEV
jgi:hypothetical protein